MEAIIGSSVEKKATVLDEVFAVLFNLVDLLTRLFGLFGVIDTFQQNASA